MKNSYITRSLHRSAFAAAMAVVALAAVTVFYFVGRFTLIDGDRGFALPSANEWISSPVADMSAALAANALIMVLLTLVLKASNVLRSTTRLPLALFAVMQMAAPALVVQFYTGILLCLTVTVCVALMFSCYRSPWRTRRIFLIFFALSLGVATQYSFALYMPVFLAGCAQMRVFNRRTVLAALLGIITPWWMIAGFGIVDLRMLEMPQFESIFTIIDSTDTLLLLVSVGVTVLLALVAFAISSVKAIAYNARTRAFNGLFAVLTLASVAAMLVDYRNLIVYIPTLNLCAAYQTAHYFTVYRGERSWIGIATVCAFYIFIYVCQTVM